MRITDKYLFFWKTGDFLSQWYPSRFIEDKILFSCAEQYMMYHKALYFKDEVTAENILNTKSPDKQKKLGRTVVGFDPNAWNEVKLDVVIQGNRLKFTQNQDLKELLLDTGKRILAEASPYDRVWGIGLSENDPDSENQEQWRGKNLLGKALMIVRSELI